MAPVTSGQNAINFQLLGGVDPADVPGGRVQPLHALVHRSALLVGWAAGMIHGTDRTTSVDYFADEDDPRVGAFEV